MKLLFCRLESDELIKVAVKKYVVSLSKYSESVSLMSCGKLFLNATE